MKRKRDLCSVMVLALALLACNLIYRTPALVRTVEPEKTQPLQESGLPPPAATLQAGPSPGAASPAAAPAWTPSRSLTLTDPASVPPPAQMPTRKVLLSPVPGKKPPQSQAAGIHPPESRAGLTRLSNLLDFRVSDRNGVEVGKIADYIVNTCETYMVYFVLEPAAEAGLEPGSRLVIPLEVVTINSGSWEAPSKSMALSLEAGAVWGAPAFPAPWQLFPLDWEPVARAYWQQAARISSLTSACRVSGGSVTTYKIAYATQLLGVSLKDGHHTVLGEVVEAILEPESGKLGFFVVRLSDAGSLVLVPLSAVNIPAAALEPGNQLELVLLKENQVLQEAPRIETVENATSAELQRIARQYWLR